MPIVNLTDRTIRSLKTNKYREDFWDQNPKGFVIRVYQDGRKRYGVIYRTQLGRRGRFDIGDASLMGLADARIKAKDILRQVEKGTDPSARKKEIRVAETFNELADSYLELHAVPHLKPRSIQDIKQALKSKLRPVWGHRKVIDISRKDIIALIERIGVKDKAPVAANHTRSVITGIFTFALQRDIIQTSPCVGLPKKYKETPRARVLTDEEIISFWLATEKEQPLIRDLFRILLLTGQRSGETRQMRWDHIVDNTWIIPNNLTKNNQEQSVPLPLQVQQILSNRENESELVFPSFTGEPLKWMYCANERIRKEMKSTVPWRVHDLRRTCATGLERLNISDSVIAAILNHTKIGRIGVTGRYARHGFEDEKRRALQMWAGYVFDVLDVEKINKQPAKVICFKR